MPRDPGTISKLAKLTMDHSSFAAILLTLTYVITALLPYFFEYRKVADLLTASISVSVIVTLVLVVLYSNMNSRDVEIVELHDYSGADQFYADITFLLDYILLIISQIPGCMIGYYGASSFLSIYKSIL